MKNQELFRRWLMGYEVDMEEFEKFLKQFPEAIVETKLYKGLHFSHYPKLNEVNAKTLSSWSNTYDNAYCFASLEKFGFVLEKFGKGYDVGKILRILSESGEILESLRNYSAKRENEVISDINPKFIRIKRVGIC